MKTVIVTGGTRGLGFETVKCLYREGYKVIAIGRKLSNELKDLINESNGNIIYEKFDFNNTDKIHGFVKDLHKRHGYPWGLINNAAIGKGGVLCTQHENDISQMIRINIEAPILFTKYVARYMLLKRQGRIVNIASIIADTGFNGLSVYAATKASLIGFTKSLSRELGKAGITVNAISPGYMATDMTSGMGSENLEKIKRRSPLGYLPQPIDVARTILHIIDVQTKSISGSVIKVDSGSTA